MNTRGVWTQYFVSVKPMFNHLSNGLTVSCLICYEYHMLFRFTHFFQMKIFELFGVPGMLEPLHFQYILILILSARACICTLRGLSAVTKATMSFNNLKLHILVKKYRHHFVEHRMKKDWLIFIAQRFYLAFLRARDLLWKIWIMTFQEEHLFIRNSKYWHFWWEHNLHKYLLMTACIKPWFNRFLSMLCIDND